MDNIMSYEKFKRQKVLIIADSKLSKENKTKDYTNTLNKFTTNSLIVLCDIDENKIRIQYEQYVITLKLKELC